MKRIVSTFAGVLALAWAGTALAQSAPLNIASQAGPGAAPAIAPPGMSRFRSAFSLTDAQAEALRAGIARTSVDHRFVDTLTGSVGFLCGLHGPDYDESASMRGADPAGKFLGAKVSLAFR